MLQSGWRTALAYLAELRLPRWRSAHLDINQALEVRLARRGAVCDRAVTGAAGIAQTELVDDERLKISTLPAVHALEAW